MNKPDSLIFDMDGTLWDAVDTYLHAWNLSLQKLGIEKSFTRAEFMPLMGVEKAKLLEAIFPDFDIEKRETFFLEADQFQQELLPVKGGLLYDGVAEGLEKLSEKYKLFIVSNCAKNVIRHFMNWSGISHLITDEVAHGTNWKPKHHNIRLLIDKHQLKSPVYIGDTDGDSKQSMLAEVPYIFVDYGFGKTENYLLKFSSFPEFTRYFMTLK